MRNRLYLVLGGLLAIVLIVVAVFISLGSNQNATTGEAQPPQKILFHGTEDLIEIGVTQDQIAAFKQAFTDFASKQNIKARDLVIESGSVQKLPRSRESAANDATTFVVIFGNHTFSAKLEIISFTGIRLYIYDRDSGNQIFDSGEIQNKENGD